MLIRGKRACFPLFFAASFVLFCRKFGHSNFLLYLCKKFHSIMKRILSKLAVLLVFANVCNSAFAAPQVGTLVRDTILEVPCVVYLPHNYAERAHDGSRRGFPVLYLQHGMFGSENDWSTSGRLLHWMDSLHREDMIAEMIIVMPDNFLGSIPLEERRALMAAPNVTPDGQPFSVEDGQHHWKKLTREQEQAYEMSGYWEEHFPEFMIQVERKYFIDTREKHRAIAGLSMGGFHTMHVSHYLMSSFDYIGLFSPVILPRETTDLVGGKTKPDPKSPYRTVGFDEQLPYSSPAYAHWMEDMRYLGQMPPMYWIAIGTDDFLYEQLQDYRKWLELNHIEYLYYESTGGHTWANWQDYLCRFLKCCFTRIW